MKYLPAMIFLCFVTLAFQPPGLRAQTVTNDDDLMRSLYPSETYEKKKAQRQQLENLTPEQRRTFGQQITRKNMSNMKTVRQRPIPVDASQPLSEDLPPGSVPGYKGRHMRRQ